MKYTVTVFTLVLFLLSQAVSAQNKVQLKKSKYLSFESNLFDFGNLKQGDGDVTTRFVYRNNSQKPLAIVEVVPECGCTSFDKESMSDDPIAPEDTGSIPIKYEASTHPGEFDKLIVVYTTIDTFELKIIGYVEPDDSDLLIRFPEDKGHLRLEANSVSFGKILHNQKKTRSLLFYNNTDSIISFNTGAIETPDYITFKMDKDSVPPKSEGEFFVTYDPVLKNDFGYVIDYVNLSSVQQPDQQIELAVRGSIEEYFDPDIDLNKAPKIQLPTADRTYEFPSVNKGDSVEHDFIIKNIGKEDLIIRKATSTCKCVTTALSHKTIKSGETGKLHVVFDTSKRKGTQVKSIILIVNDPKEPVVNLKLKGKIQD